MRQRPRKAAQLAIHPFSETLLAELKQENAHRSEGRVIKSEGNSYSAVCTLSGCCDLRELALQRGLCNVKYSVMEIVHLWRRKIALT